MCYYEAYYALVHCNWMVREKSYIKALKIHQFVENPLICKKNWNEEGFIRVTCEAFLWNVKMTKWKARADTISTHAVHLTIVYQLMESPFINKQRQSYNVYKFVPGKISQLALKRLRLFWIKIKITHFILLLCGLCLVF